MRFITSTREFQSIYQNYTKFSGNLFIYLIENNSSEEEFAVGIVTSKKVGKAVRRNKIKRRVKSFFRENRAQISAKGKMIIIAKPAAADADWQEIKKELHDFLEKIKTK
ncbi:MAG: ribonuclease P protein component [Candidatus Cloacimonadota bacterium]|nr:MAG: ribonuclease P protein component [Candidatus Cloacimonadota bacterium]